METSGNKAYLLMLVETMYMLDCIDKLKGTTAYKHRLRWGLRIVEEELLKLDPDVDALWDKCCKEDLYLLMEGVKRSMEFITNLSVEQLLAIGRDGICINEPVNEKGDS